MFFQATAGTDLWFCQISGTPHDVEITAQLLSSMVLMLTPSDTVMIILLENECHASHDTQEPIDYQGSLFRKS